MRRPTKRALAIRADELRGLESTAYSSRTIPLYVWLVSAGIIANMFSGFSGQLGLPIGPDRLLFAVGAVLAILERYPRRTLRVQYRFETWLALIFVVYVAQSGITAGTLTTSSGAYALLDRVVVPFLLFFTGRIVFDSQKRLQLLLQTLVIIAIYLNLTAIFEIAHLHQLVWPRYILNPNVGSQFGRARGPFAQSEADGLTIAICGAAAFVGWQRFMNGWRQVALVAVLLTPVGIILTQTRSVWLGAIVGLAAVFVFRPDYRVRISLAAIIVGVCLGGLLAFSSQAREHLSARASSQLSVDDRRSTDGAAIRIIEQRPLEGVGWQEFEQVGYQYVREGGDYPINNVAIEVHNVWLSRAAELGIPGGLLWVICVLAGPGRAIVTKPTTAEGNDWHALAIWSSAVWITASMLSPLSYPLVNSLAFLLPGIVLGDRYTTVRLAQEDELDNTERPVDALSGDRWP